MSLTPREQTEVENELALAVAPVTPSPELKARIMEKIAQTSQLPALVEGESGAIDGGNGSRADVGAALGSAENKARSRWFARPATILVAAAAAALLFAGGTVLGLGVSANRTVDIQAEGLAGLTAAPDLQRASATVSGGGDATLIWSLEQRKSAILVQGLPELPAGKTYELWYMGAAGPISAGTFEPGATATTWRVLDGKMSAGDTVGVTVEPSGGSEQPTTDPIITIASTQS